MHQGDTIRVLVVDSFQSQRKLELHFNTISIFPHTLQRKELAWCNFLLNAVAIQ